MSSTKWYNVENLSLARRVDILGANGDFITIGCLDDNRYSYIVDGVSEGCYSVNELFMQLELLALRDEFLFVVVHWKDVLRDKLCVECKGHIFDTSQSVSRVVFSGDVKWIRVANKSLLGYFALCSCGKEYVHLNNSGLHITVDSEYLMRELDKFSEGGNSFYEG